MGLFKSINSWFGKIAGKRHISVMNNGEERWHADISPVMFVTISVAILTLIFIAALLLLSYTPLLDYMPGHSAEVARSRETLTQNIVRLDSLERKMNEMLLYNENRLLVVSGKTPAMQSVKNDSLSSSKKFVGPSSADAQLRNKIENDEQYRLVGANADSATPAKLNTVAPMYGIITKRFNTQGYTGVDVKSEKDAVVSAIAEGVVVSKELASDSTYCVMIQHKDNYLSIYRNLASALISKGERVQSAQDVGYAQNGEDEKSVLKFELWCDGKAVNPEQYIEF